jgi:hypothetical protein
VSEMVKIWEAGANGPTEGSAESSVGLYRDSSQARHEQFPLEALAQSYVLVPAR